MNALIILSIIGLFTMIIGLFKVSKSIVFAIILLGLTAAAGSLISEWNTDYVYFNDMVFFNNYAISFSILLIFLTLLILLLSDIFISNLKEYVTEHYALFIFSLVGMICITAFDHLAMLFVGIEIMSIPLYILAGSEKKNTDSNESSMKYFLMGSFATGLLLMGITLIYGETGSFHIDSISQALVSNSNMVYSPIFILGILFVLIGLSFKVSIAPFHFWTPDVYQGAPTLVTAFMSTAVKVAGFAGLFRLFYYCFLPASDVWVMILAVLAATTITIGGISAVFQTSLKRILAYSSISHAGYMLIVLIATADNSYSTLLFYSLAYSIASIIAFTVIMLIQKSGSSDEIESFNGLAKSNPLMAFLLTLSMISLAGIPLTGGFFAKFYILSAGVDSGYTWLVLIAIVNAIIGIYYYFKVIIAMYFKESPSNEVLAPAMSFLYKIVLIICGVLTVQLGLFPDLIYGLF
jgi:NADH-quinone oxidoreductase subunit N